MKINDKEYTYNLNRKDMFNLTRIISKLGINPGASGDSDKDIATALVTELINNLDKAEIETLNFIAKIYNVKPAEIETLGFTAELALWWNVYKTEKSFFMKLLLSGQKEQKNIQFPTN